MARVSRADKRRFGRSALHHFCLFRERRLPAGIFGEASCAGRQDARAAGNSL